VELDLGPSTSTSELVTRTASGDEGAFAELARRHRQAMVSTAINFVDPQAAEDVVQAALEDARRELLEGTVPENLGAWLRGIARNRARDELRARLRQPPPEVWPPAQSAYEVAEQREEVRGISRVGALASLPLLEPLRRGADRVRELTPGRARVGVAAAATVALVAVLSAAMLGGGSSEGEPDRPLGPATANAGSVNLGQPASPASVRSYSDSARPASSRPSRRTQAQRPGSSSEPTPTAASAPPAQASPATSAPPVSAPPQSPPSSPTPTAPPPTPPAPPPDPPDDPPPAPPSSSCGSVSQIVPCVAETVDGVLGSLPGR